MDFEVSELNAIEVARLLRVGKNKVYDLAKSGELPSYSIGRKLRFSMVDVEAYIQHSKEDGLRGDRGIDAAQPGFTSQADGGAPRLGGTSSADQWPSTPRSASDVVFALGGNDMILDMLSNYLANLGIRAQRVYAGSYHMLVSLYLGDVQAAGIHLYDGETDTYNISYVKHVAPGMPVVVLHLAMRNQGLLVRERNPKGLRAWGDLLRGDIVIANREKGSGSRVLLDERLRLFEANPAAIKGYDREFSSGLEVGSFVSRGGADVGIGPERILHQVSGIGFLPLQRESYDLVISKGERTEPAIRLIKRILGSTNFREEFQGMVGYDVSRMGAVLYES